MSTPLHLLIVDDSADDAQLGEIAAKVSEKRPTTRVLDRPRTD